MLRRQMKSRGCKQRNQNLSEHFALVTEVGTPSCTPLGESAACCHAVIQCGQASLHPGTGTRTGTVRVFVVFL
eukprot:scaffold303484_cov28-Prasinocladus_malaysianus.AAC.1